jgi:hypothetical protein
MQGAYGEGVATHTGAESCVVDRKDGDEALTGERAGRPSNREINNPPQGGTPAIIHRLAPRFALCSSMTSGLISCHLRHHFHDRRHLASGLGDVIE